MTTRVVIRPRFAVACAAAAVVGLAVAAAVGTPRPLVTGRFLLDAGAITGVGLAVLGWLVSDAQRRDAVAARAAATKAAVVVGAGWAAVALVLLWLQTAEVTGQPAFGVSVRAVADYVGTFNIGAALLITAGCAIAFGVLASRAAPDGLLAVVAMLGLLPGPVTGHGATEAAHELAVLSIAVHVSAAALWVGGFGALLVIAGTRRALLANALPRFSRVAGWCVAGLAVSGMITAGIELSPLPSALGSSYGRIVLAKAVLLAALAMLGYLVRRRVLPAVVAHRHSALAAFAAAELTLMAVALGLAAALTRAPPSVLAV